MEEILATILITWLVLAFPIGYYNGTDDVAEDCLKYSEFVHDNITYKCEKVDAEVNRAS